jgi:hypothetical protein
LTAYRKLITEIIRWYWKLSGFAILAIRSQTKNERDTIMDELQTQALTHSPDIGALALALAEAHKAFKPLKKEVINPFFKSKYADLAAVIDATDDGLSKNGLAIVQSPMLNGNSVTVTTMIVHSSGQWMRADLIMPSDKMTAQGVGAAITYARRYSYQAFVSVAAEVDDDGCIASGKDVKEVSMPKPPAKKPALFPELPKQGMEEPFPQKFWRIARGKGKTEIAISEYIGRLGYEKTTEIPPTKFREALDWAAGVGA